MRTAQGVHALDESDTLKGVPARTAGEHIAA
jgi:hypothetical protein